VSGGAGCRLANEEGLGRRRRSEREGQLGFASQPLTPGFGVWMGDGPNCRAWAAAFTVDGLL
jgi:hypothetical protein